MKKIILLLLIPTFSLMLRQGIFTMHDFHVFRQFEFAKCISAKTFPCRWAPDAGLGYGEPVFNFYGQFPYWVGQVFHLIGLQIIDSVKVNFILTIIVSGFGMYFLGCKYWGRLGGLVSALFYVYAPYHAVDIWVRGALNEAYALALFPLVFLALDNYLDDHQPRHLWWLVLWSTLLVITHNLSVLMFSPFLLIWALLRRRITLDLIGAAAAVFLLSAFYLLPVIFESRLVTLNLTTSTYYNYQLHWTTLKQLFLSRFWGYGGSVWGPNDTMSFSIGYLQWLVPLFLLINKKTRWFTLLGFLAVFMTHGKSVLVWRFIPPLAYIQFPWRFLSVASFFLALSVGAISRRFVVPLLLLLLLLNASQFRPDIWRSISDREQFSGTLWDEQRSSALQDFWPKTAKEQPSGFAPSAPQVLLTTDTYQKIQYPIVYFPGWKAEVELFPSGPLGLVTARVPLDTQINLRFTNTPVRTIANITSLAALICFVISGWYLLRPRA